MIWDQGRKLAYHKDIGEHPRQGVCFAHPASPWPFSAGVSATTAFGCGCGAHDMMSEISGVLGCHTVTTAQPSL